MGDHQQTVLEGESGLDSPLGSTDEVNGLALTGSLKEVLTLAWPLMLSTGLFSLVLFFDRMFLYWDSETAASASMTSGSLYWSIVCIPMGAFGYTSVFVAQYIGAGQKHRDIHNVAQGVWLSLFVVPLLIVVGWQCEILFGLFVHSSELIASEASYLRWLLPGGVAMIIRAPITGYFAGLGKTRTLLAVDVIGAVLNIFLDYALIFGKFGFPKLSVIGAGIASSFSFIVTAVILFALAYQHVRKTGALEALVGGKAWWYFSPIEAKRLLYFGTPAGAQMAAESMSFSVIMLSVGSLGEYAMAATTLALGVNILAFVPMNGLGMALGVLVGQCLTAGKVKAAERGVRSAIIIAMIYTSFFVLAYGVFTDWTLSLYAFQMPPERFETIRPILRLLLRFIAAYCLFDAIQIVFVGAIKGAGDTFFVLIGSAIIGLSVVGLGFAGTFVFESSVYYWWAVISIWVLVMAIVFSSRFATGKWKTMRVIEADLTIAD